MKTSRPHFIIHKRIQPMKYPKPSKENRILAEKRANASQKDDCSLLLTLPGSTEPFKGLDRPLSQRRTPMKPLPLPQAVFLPLQRAEAVESPAGHFKLSLRPRRMYPGEWNIQAPASSPSSVLPSKPFDLENRPFTPSSLTSYSKLCPPRPAGNTRPDFLTAENLPDSVFMPLDF